MSAKILDGKKVAMFLREEIALQVQKMNEKFSILPKLCVVIVGDDPASKVYVKNKKIACEKAGMLSQIIEMPFDSTQAELNNVIISLNKNKNVHGILVQSPIPNHLNEDALVDLIDPCKDVDCFHPNNIGKLFLGKQVFEPCTPSGIIELLKYYEIKTKGKNVTIIGRSNIVGKPLSILLLQKGDYGDATVTTCHSRTENISEITRNADILIAAIGKPEFVRGNMIKKGAVVIDVGINRVDDLCNKNGYVLKGDVNFEEAKDIASYITPVPGGIGPMTIAVLLKNTLKAAKFYSINAE